MAGLVQKTYGDALFELILEETPSKLSDAKDELNAVNTVISEVPELIKLSKTPTITKEEKAAVDEADKEIIIVKLERKAVSDSDDSESAGEAE